MGLLLLLGVLLSAPIESARDLGAQAKKLFSQKKYKDACPMWERAARLAPDDAALWGDLGYCLARQWELAPKDRPSPARAAAIDALLRSIRLGGERARKAAYYNLNVLLEWTEVDLPGWPHAPSSEEAACSVIRAPAPLGCDRAALACTRWQAVGYKDRGEAAIVRLRACGPDCQTPGDSEQLTPVLGDPDHACAGVSGPGVACGENQVHESCSDEAPDGSGKTQRMCGYGDDDRSGCVVVLVDPCAGRIALACGDWGGKQKRKPIFQELPLPR